MMEKMAKMQSKFMENIEKTMSKEGDLPGLSDSSVVLVDRQLIVNVILADNLAL